MASPVSHNQMVKQHCWLIHPSIFGRSWGTFFFGETGRGKRCEADGQGGPKLRCLTEASDEDQQMPLLVDGYSPFRGVFKYQTMEI